MRIIYEPKGRALEYAPLAVSLYRGCPHGCVYCFAPASTNIKREKFLQPYVRKNALELLELDAIKLMATGDQREILMSFTTDPYQSLEDERKITRKAIEILIRYGLHFTILSKAGLRSLVDIDIMAANSDLCRYGTTLVFSEEKDRDIWEPHASSTIERIYALSDMHDRGVRTWVSMEPVIYPAQTLELIRQTWGFVDEYRIGKFNHTDNPELQRFMDKIEYLPPFEDEWRSFVYDAKTLLDEHGCRYVFKKDLQPYFQKVRS